MANDGMLDIDVWGDFACFTRPENKVERVSYPVMTPSAARGVLEAVFWKPQFRWVVREIHVLRPMRFMSILRNEVTDKQSERAARAWHTEGRGGFDATAARTQRHSLVLRDVAYTIRADIVLASDAGAEVAKYRDQFRRRVRQGRCFATPFLGCREFSAFFCEAQGRTPIDVTEDLGRMVLDMEFQGGGRGATPEFFDARLDRGVLRPPVPVGAR